MRLTLVDLLVNDERAVGLVEGLAEREGRTLDERGVHVFRIAGGRIVEGWFLYYDQEAYDAFWGSVEDS